MNYKHLHYFWMVARHGSLSRAAKALSLTPQTLSGQLGQFQEALGLELFERRGRGLVLTVAGRQIFHYANQMFTLGSELEALLKQGGTPGAPLSLRVGIADVVPKLVAQLILEPAFQLNAPLQIVCREGTSASLIGQLADHRLDLVISDTPGDAPHGGGLFSHLLGESAISFFAAERMPTPGEFPQLLHGKRFLLPGESSMLRRSLQTWFAQRGIAPIVVGEFDDGALMKAFGQRGLGLFAAPSAIEEAIVEQYRVRVVGRTQAIREKFYAISAERRLKHPAVVAVCDAARKQLFG